ncbi:hypothetical protein PCL_07154 [Purpureocillium lilacinum]|uniref:Uncharacterized protein n=1 Tax=Purpureocillium lilacinum TaxID=33203 RepID=A0A2U3DT18_PURLI|nr:hypothetical protein PCL_07154 [Purpureocillium lilacinum]
MDPWFLGGQAAQALQGAGAASTRNAPSPKRQHPSTIARRPQRVATWDGTTMPATNEAVASLLLIHAANCEYVRVMSPPRNLCCPLTRRGAGQDRGARAASYMFPQSWGSRRPSSTREATAGVGLVHV